MEKQGVYVEVLLAINFFCDTLLLKGCFLLCRRSVPEGRLYAAALLGALSSLLLFVPLNPWQRWLCQLLLAAVLCRIAEPWPGKRAFIRSWLCLFALNFLFGAVMLALRLTVGGGWLLLNNGVVYFHLPPLYLVAAISLAFALLRLVQGLLSRQQADTQLQTVQLRCLGQELCCSALMDSGNQLREPFSGWPVVVLERQRLPVPIPKSQLRWIPCSSIHGRSLLPAVKGEELRWSGLSCRGFYVALSSEPLAEGVDLLLPVTLEGSPLPLHETKERTGKQQGKAGKGGNKE